VAQERASAEHLLLLDTGDALVGGAELGDLTAGAAIVAGMNLMDYDAMALGPKELGLGLDTLRQRIEEASFPFVSTNAVLESSGELLAPPYAVVEVGALHAAIVGLTRPPDVALEGIQVVDPREALARYLPEAAAQADLVILLTNVPFDQAVVLASEVPGIDLVVSALPVAFPVEAVRVPGTATLAVTAEMPMPGHTGRQIGRLTATVQPDGSLAGESWAAVPLDSFIVDDPEMAELLQRYQP
jgi:2',3'-cyclic-nucleotide 2'-phosphodiesterase (5'-nucleotidase family)